MAMRWQTFYVLQIGANWKENEMNQIAKFTHASSMIAIFKFGPNLQVHLLTIDNTVELTQASGFNMWL